MFLFKSKQAVEKCKIEIKGGIYFLFIVLFCFSIIPNSVWATHAAGAELSYRSLGGLVYELEATFYRDCGGTPEPGNISITYRSVSCNYSRTALAIKVASNNGVEMTMPCATSASTCNGGVTTGVRKWTYRTIVTLPSACTDWLFSFRICCRNCTVTTIQSPCAAGSELYVEAGLNNVDGPENSSPVYTNSPIAFVCLGQNFNYNQGAVDMDGDSLSYELITPKTSASSEVAWIAPASTHSPLASSTPFVIDPVTGDINFTPSAMQISVMAIRINEYRNGIWVGSTVRDMQVYTQNCFNAIPYASGINGSSSYISSVCAGDTVCFTIQTYDSDLLQNVSVSWVNPIQGSTITETTNSRPSLQFCWIPTLADVSNIPKTFTVLVRDDACPQNGTQTFSYSVFVSGFQVSATATHPTCMGTNNGSAGILGGPLPGYSYEWNTVPPQFNETASGLGPGSYTVVATSYTGCMATATVELYQPDSALSVTTSSSGTITCQSGNIGVAQANAINGTPPYSYLWSNGSAMSQLNGLGHGTYTVTVTDANGCSSQSSVSILMAAGTLTPSVTASSMVSCYNGTDGSIQVSVSGGTAPYSYWWSNGATSASITNLSVGNYDVSITDANGCSSNLTATISGPSTPLSAAVTHLNQVSCYGGSDGLISLTATGGTSPYSYSWSNGSTGTTINNVSSGNYHVMITDAMGCVLNFSSSVTQPSTHISASILTISNVNCVGESTGSVDLSVSGGELPYTFLWSNGSSVNNPTGLEAGSYSVTVSDANGCQDTLTVKILEPEVPVSIVVTNIDHIHCNQPSTGSISISGFGGTPPLTYLWNNGSTAQNLSNIPHGIYTLTVSDSNGCTTEVSSHVQNYSSPIVISSTNVQNVLCFNMANGAIKIAVSGGTGPYTYLWSTGAITEDIQNLVGGVYTVTVTDQHGCTSQNDFTIEQPSSPLVPFISVSSHVNCYGTTQGGLSLQANGGTPPYSYLWSNGETTPDLTNLETGTYTITVTDAGGCNAILSEYISQPLNPLSGTIEILSPVKCYGAADASVLMNTNGGTPPLAYNWSNGESTSSLYGIAAGNYSVVVTDAMGCTFIQTIVLTDPQQQFLLDGSVTSANCLSGVNGTIELTLSGGTSPFSYLWSNGNTSSVLTTSVPGVYSVVVTDSNGCTLENSFNLLNKSQIRLTSDGPLTICVGETVTLQVDSFADVQYQWYYQGNVLNGATAMSFTTPAAGLYHVLISGACGDFISDTVLVEVKSIGNVSITNMQIVCPPETANLFATGGVSYSWSPATYITFTNVPDPIVSPMTTTEYTVEITNEYGCKTSLSTNIAVVCDSLLVPTGFSPNDDGVNDGYVIDGIENYPGNKLWVYNRWGKLVFKATDYNNSWDGVSNISGIYMSKKLPVGTYYYILDLNDRSKPRAGYIIIRR